MTTPFDIYPDERRRSPRISGAGISVKYFTGITKESPAQSSVKDICIHGICIHMLELVELSETIIMDIFLAKSEIPIRAQGVVVWYNAKNLLDCFNVGIKFEKISEEDQKRLSSHIEASLKNS